MHRSWALQGPACAVAEAEYAFWQGCDLQHDCLVTACSIHHQVGCLVPAEWYEEQWLLVHATSGGRPDTGVSCPCTFSSSAVLL